MKWHSISWVALNLVCASTASQKLRPHCAFRVLRWGNALLCNSPSSHSGLMVVWFLGASCRIPCFSSQPFLKINAIEQQMLLEAQAFVCPTTDPLQIKSGSIYHFRSPTEKMLFRYLKCQRTDPKRRSERTSHGPPCSRHNINAMCSQDLFGGASLASA